MLFKIVRAVLIILLVLVAAVAGWTYRAAVGSMPLLDGEIEVAGLAFPVTVERGVCPAEMDLFALAPKLLRNSVHLDFTPANRSNPEPLWAPRLPCDRMAS